MYIFRDPKLPYPQNLKSPSLKLLRRSAHPQSFVLYYFKKLQHHFVRPALFSHYLVVTQLIPHDRLMALLKICSFCWLPVMEIYYLRPSY